MNKISRKNYKMNEKMNNSDLNSEQKSLMKHDENKNNAVAVWRFYQWKIPPMETIVYDMPFLNEVVFPEQ